MAPEKREWGMFTGTWAFLSNLWQEADGLSVEHRYQAAKFRDERDQAIVMRASTPTEARRLGRRRFPVREDWDEVRDQVMRELVERKFRDANLRRLLLQTGDEELVEGSQWDDTYWGVDLATGEGENRLGELLMDVRARIRSGEL